MRHTLLLTSLAACTPDPAPSDGVRPPEADTSAAAADDTSRPTDDTSAPADDTGAPVTWTPLAPSCEPPGPDGQDPFTLTASVKHTETGPGSWFVELLDVVHLPERERVVATGQGGLVVYDLVPGQDPVKRGHAGAGAMSFLRYYHLELDDTDTDRVWVTHRDIGLDTFDLSDPDHLARRSRVDAEGFEGLARKGDRLYVASTRGQLAVFDLTDPDAPAALAPLEGLGRAWDVSIRGDVAYVADADLGVVAVDLATSGAPTLASSVASAGQPMRLLAADDGFLYVAAGAGGLEIYDLTDPLAPTLASRTDVGGGARDVAVADGLVGVTTQEAVVLLDVGVNGTPAAPRPHAYQETEQFAMTLDATDSTWIVGDWNILGSWAVTRGLAPAIDVSTDVVAFLDGAETREITVTNRGGGTLELAGMSLPEGITAETTATSLAPGQVARVALTWDGTPGIDLVRGCLASDDPGRPQVELSFTSGADGEGRFIGQQAPDFTLQDLEGRTHTLSEQLGHPVVLAYFATW